MGKSPIVDNYAFRSMAAHERLHRLSIGYLNSAVCLCQDLNKHPDVLDWPRASVVYFCLHHAIELFLKACILVRSPGEKFTHHNIDKLQDRYCELYPDLKNEFHIESPWDVGLDRASELFQVVLDIHNFEYKTDQVYRYMTGKNGESTKSIHVFSPETGLLMTERFQNDFARIWQAVTIPRSQG